MRCLLGGVTVTGEPEVELTVACEVHYGTGRLVVRREPGRIVLDADGGRCCVLAIGDAAAVALFEVLGEWLG